MVVPFFVDKCPYNTENLEVLPFLVNWRTLKTSSCPSMKKIIVPFCLFIMIFSCGDDDIITSDTIPDVVAEFRTNLSDLNIYTGELNNLEISSKAFEYETNTPLFTDYAHKERLIALPNNSSLTFDGDGLPIFPDNTVIAKTFYYNLDERDPSLGRQIIETRVLIKLNGNWESGDYIWNQEQTEAVLDPNGSILPVTWVDNDGNQQTTNYEIPSNADCFTCHSTYDNLTPIGPKLRALNFETNGVNQLQELINSGAISGISNPNSVLSIPNWLDNTVSLEERARAYLDINCAHCHTAGGYCENQSTLRLDFGTSLVESNIIDRKESINLRISSFNDGFSMPFIGTTMTHSEGISLIQAYLDTL